MKIIHDPLKLGGFKSGAYIKNLELFEGLKNKTFTVGTIFEIEKKCKNHIDNTFTESGTWILVEEWGKHIVETDEGAIVTWDSTHYLRKIDLHEDEL